MTARALTGDDPSTHTYELIAIGSGPAGRGAAVQAAKLGKRAAIVERESVLGGASTNTGTVPSKTLRAAVVELTGTARGVYESPFRPRNEITIDDLLWRTQGVIEEEREAIQDELRRNHVDILKGTASFVDARTLRIACAGKERRASAERFVIAVGTKPSRPSSVAFDARTVLDSDEILRLQRIPRTLTVVGASAAGLEYASMLSALGTRVTVVDKRADVLTVADRDVVEAFRYHLSGTGVGLRLGEEAKAVERTPDGPLTSLHNGERLASEVVLYTAGRHGATGELDLAAAGLEADAGGRIAVGRDFRTSQRHIFAAGDVVGSPGLAATSMEKGRLAALAAFGEPATAMPLLPYCIHTIPEISFVGSTERDLSESGTPYVRGFARYRELPRGDIAGDRTGLVKILVHAHTRDVLGVHIFGTSATELVHIGQTAMAASLTVDYFVDAVFNAPTFAAAYKVAARDAADRLAEIGAANDSTAH